MYLLIYLNIPASLLLLKSNFFSTFLKALFIMQINQLIILLLLLLIIIIILPLIIILSAYHVIICIINLF